MPIRADLRHFYRGEAWERVRQACRDRAGDHCEQCGKKNGVFSHWHRDGHAVMVQCGAAHLNNVAGDDRPENLAWLCRVCHLHHDEPFHRNTRATRKDAARPLLAAQGATS